MYGYQSNNSQPYNYQNPNGTSYPNIGQYTGHYSYYSNASTAYNAFPSNDQPCSSLGVLPQEYSQVGNGIPRPYYFDSNNSYPRPYQALPYNQSVDLPNANSYNSCPRNCLCCESINTKYFAPSNSLQQQTNTQSICDSSLNTSFNGFRKGLSSGRWRESSSQLSNNHEANDTPSVWPMSKYGTSCKSEPCMWPLPQKQPTKLENTEHLATGNAYMLPQQHQRKSIPNSHSYSVVHTNSILSVQTSRPPQGRSEDLIGNCFSGYPCASDYKKNIAEHVAYAKPHISKITPARPTCNLSSNCEGGFPYKFSSPNANVYHENQKCAIDPPKLVSQLPSTLVESIQRRHPGSNILDGANEMQYCQPGVISSVHSIDAPTRRNYSIPTESDPRILLNCGSSASTDVLPAPRMQLPPIHSLKSTGIVMNGQPKDFCDDITYNPPRSSNKGNLDGSYRIPSARNLTLSNVSIRNVNTLNPEKVPDISSENACRIQSEMGNNCALTNFMPNSRYGGKQFYSEPPAEFSEVDNKLRICKDVPIKPIPSMSANPVIGDLRHFLSTWDDGDDEESNPIVPCALPLGNDYTQEQLVREEDLQNECTTVDQVQEKTDNASVDARGNSTTYVLEPKEVPVSNSVYNCANSYKVFSSSSGSDLYHVHSNNIVGIDKTVVGDIDIPPKSCGELEHCAEQTVIKPGVDAFQTEAEHGSQETSNQLELSSHRIITNISEKNSISSSAHVENIHIPTKNVEDRKPSTPTSEKEDEVNSEILNSSASHVAPSGIINGASTKENQGDTPLNPLYEIMKSREEPSCIRNVQRRIPDSKNSEFPNKLPKESTEDNQVPGIVGGMEISSSSSMLSKATNVLNDTITCGHNSENYLTSEKPEYASDDFIWCNSESKHCTFEPKDVMVGNNFKTVEEQQEIQIKEMENDHTMNGKIVMDQDLNSNRNFSDGCNHYDKCELGIIENIDKNITCSSSIGDDSKTPIVEQISVLTEKNISNDLIEEIKTSLKKEKSASLAENSIFISHLEKTVCEESSNRETCKNPQENVLGGVLNFCAGKKEQRKFEMLNIRQSTENETCEVGIVCRGNGKVSSSVHEKKSFKSTRLKHEVECKGSFLKAFKRVPKKSSCLVALQLRRKYCMMGLKNQTRSKLARIRNGKGVKWKSVVMSLIGKTNNRRWWEKKCVKNYSEKQICKSPDDIVSKKTQKIYCESKNKPDENSGNLKDADFLKNEDGELQKIHSINSEQMGLLGEENEYSKNETMAEGSSGENNVEVLLSIEEREAHSENFEGNCIIGNVEVFMGTVEVANSFEEAADVENVLPEEPSIQEEASNIQYWGNYELGNDLGVAMEIEVGSEIYSADCVDLKQHLEEGILAYNGLNERIGGVEKEVFDHQEREKLLVKHADGLNDVKTADENIEKKTMHENCTFVEETESQDKLMNKQKSENIQNGELDFNDSITSNFTGSHPKKNSVVHRSIIEDNISQSVTTYSKNLDAEEDIMSNCAQEVKGPFPESHSANDINDAIMPEISCTHETSEEMEPSVQESQEDIPSSESTLNPTSVEAKDNTFHKILQNCNKKMNNSMFISNGRDLTNSHSNVYSNREYQKEKNSVIIESSNQFHHQDSKSVVMPPNHSATNLGKDERVSIPTKDEAVNQVGPIEMTNYDYSRQLFPLQNNQSCKNKPSATDDKNQMSLESKTKKKLSSSNYKAECNHHLGGSDKIIRKQSLKLKYIQKSSTIEEPMKESGSIIHQQKPPKRASITKTKASLKRFGNTHLKSLNCQKFDFWRNRSWHHKKLFRQIFKKSTTPKILKIPHRIMPQPSKYVLPHILQICSTPPPKPVSPLPMLGDAVNASDENSSSNVSNLPFKMKTWEGNVDDSTAVSSSCYPLVMKECSNNSDCIYPSHSNTKFSSNGASRSFCHATREEGILPSSLHSKPLPVINSVPYNDQKMAPQKVIKSDKYNEEKAVIDSGCFNAHPVGNSTLHILDETKSDSSWSMLNSTSVTVDSNPGASPHVRISFKKVLNGSKKNVWMKKPIPENPVKKQDIFLTGEPKTAKRVSSTECESPLPKVTIKKKSGEKGYQSFLSGFSSASSSPSTSPTVQSKSNSPLHGLANTEKPSSFEYNGALAERLTDGVSVEGFPVSPDFTRVNESHDLQDVKISGENSAVKHTICANVVEKKEGSGLVFVIRGLSGKIKECSMKDKDTECKQQSLAKDCDLINSNMQDTSTCATGMGDDDWESGPWNVWQPVVKLFRSCELDHLALKLHSVNEDCEEKNTDEELHNSQESPRREEYPTFSGNEMTPKHAHNPSQDKTKEFSQKSKLFHERLSSSKNQYGEIILNRKGPHINFGTNQVEFDMIMRECDRLNLPKKKPKPGNKFQSAHKLTVQRNTHALNPVGCGVKGKVLDRKEIASTELEKNKISVKEASLVKGQVECSEKNDWGNDREINPNISSRGVILNEKINKMEEKTWESCILGNHKEKDKQGIKAKIKTEAEGGASDDENPVKLVNSKNPSSPRLKNLHILSKSVPNKEWEGKVKQKAAGDNSESEDVSSIVQEPVKEDPQRKSLKCDKERNAEPTNQSPYACEACCRTFSSQKWLLRHCRGVSHSRVENAQRQAVQALLLLLTGNESHLLQPLTEKEFSHLRRWSSHAVPSPLQLALNEFLDTT